MDDVGGEAAGEMTLLNGDVIAMTVGVDDDVESRSWMNPIGNDRHDSLSLESNLRRDPLTY